MNTERAFEPHQTAESTSEFDDARLEQALQNPEVAGAIQLGDAKRAEYSEKAAELGKPEYARHFGIEDRLMAVAQQTGLNEDYTGDSRAQWEAAMSKAA